MPSRNWVVILSGVPSLVPIVEDKRLLHAEERIAWLERHVAEQDKAMLELGEELLRIRKQLLEFRARFQTLTDQSEGGAPLDEKPPHY